MAKYFWLKMHKDFFKRHDIQIIESMTNGKDYILFYLKLLVESTSHEGFLRFSDTIPYNDEMLSVVTKTNVDIVRSAIKIFSDLGMMEIQDDGTIFLTECEKMIGTMVQDEHTRESTRLRVRKHREKQKLLQNRYSNATCNGEIELEKEKEIELEIELDNMSETDIQTIKDRWNSLNISNVSIIRKGTSRHKSLNQRIKEYGMAKVIEAIDLVDKSSFLKGENKRRWLITFDWFLKPNNFVKVLEGNYSDNVEKKNKIDDFINEFLGGDND